MWSPTLILHVRNRIGAPHRSQLAAEGGFLRCDDEIRKTGQGDGRQEADDGNNQHEFNESETRF